MKNILKKIICGAEITTIDGLVECCLNKYNSKPYEIIDRELIKTLIEMDIIEFESGNFETHERHYRLNDKFVSRENNVKTIKIGAIWKAILTNNCQYIYLPKHSMQMEIQNSFSELKNQLLRKEKLKKINENL
jgi:activator of 2-hydroxyglutaryl-CoA dehydratase